MIDSYCTIDEIQRIASDKNNGSTEQTQLTLSLLHKINSLVCYLQNDITPRVLPIHYSKFDTCMINGFELSDQLKRTLKSDFLYYFPSNTQYAELIADTIRSVTHHSVHEIMAGTGWLCKALQEQGLPVTASDNFSFLDYENISILNCCPDTSCKLIAEQHDVVQLDALKAIETTDSKVILLCLPQTNEELFTQIFDACHLHGKMIITIACGSESIKSKVVGYVAINEFHVGCHQGDKYYSARKLAEARMHHVKQVNIGNTTLWCGFYKSIPSWYRMQQLQNTTCTIV